MLLSEARQSNELGWVGLGPRGALVTPVVKVTFFILLKHFCALVIKDNLH